MNSFPFQQNHEVYMLYKASAPGSLMLLGEFAVLNGKTALVCAIDKRIEVNLTPLHNQEIKITSELGTHVTTISQLKVEKPFQFVLEAIKATAPLKGFHLKIESQFSDKIGFGSSAAVTVATLAVIKHWLDQPLHLSELLIQARDVIRAVQGRGSGADVAASVYGGIVAYRAQPEILVEKFAFQHPLTAVYSGFKTPTPTVIQHVNERFVHFPKIHELLIESIGECADSGVAALRAKDWIHFGKMMAMQQGLMESLGVSLPVLRQIVEKLQQEPTILGAKISGSGLGDCVIGLGEANLNFENDIMPIAIKMTSDGVRCEKA